MSLINIKNVYKSYTVKKSKLSVLENINLEVENGDFLALLGDSGCGKSTFLRILGCLESYDKGEYVFDKQNINSLNPAQIAKIRNKSIGFVFQNFGLIPEMTAFENIEIPLGYAGVKKSDRVQRVHELLEQFGLPDKADAFPNQLSGGQQQRIAVARAIANNPRVLLADEPTGNLDKDNSVKIINIFKNLNEKGITVIMVTHDLKIAEYAKKSLYIKDLEK
ncbi:MAG: ABC transporter ATP-binding protein [Ruminococcus sp.]|nr:ABC transporter ATP-binding protein [Ruminococcus sp.]